MEDKQLASQEQSNQAITPAYYEDEISLVDLWLVLAKRKKLILATIIAFSVLGVGAALLLPKNYAYRTTIEIGTRLEGERTVLIEGVESVLAKVNETYIPLAQHQYREKNNDDDELHEIKASIPRKSHIIVLASKGKEAKAEVYKALHLAVVEGLKQNHARILDVVRNNLALEKNKAERDLEEKAQQVKVIGAELKRVDISAGLASKQIKESESLIKNAKQNRTKAIREARDEARAMTLLMLDNEVQQNHTRLARLEERLHVDLADKRDKLEKSLADNKRSQLNVKDNITRIKLQIANTFLQETRAVVPAMQSIKPGGLSKKALVMLSIVLGGMVAVFAAFFMEFLGKVRETTIKSPDQKEKIS